MNELYSLNCNQNSTLYFWCGFATRGAWTQCSSFGNTAQLKITNNGIVKATDGSANYTSYNHRHGGWNSTSEWATVSDGLAAGNRVTMSIHMNGALTESGVINPALLLVIIAGEQSSLFIVEMVLTLIVDFLD